MVSFQVASGPLLEKHFIQKMEMERDHHLCLFLPALSLALGLILFLLSVVSLWEKEGQWLQTRFLQIHKGTVISPEPLPSEERIILEFSLLT